MRKSSFEIHLCFGVHLARHSLITSINKIKQFRVNTAIYRKDSRTFARLIYNSIRSVLGIIFMIWLAGLSVWISEETCKPVQRWRMLLINCIDVKPKELLSKSFHYSQLKWIIPTRKRDKVKLSLPKMDRSNMTNDSGGGWKGFPASRPCTFVQSLQTWIRRGWRLSLPRVVLPLEIDSNSLINGWRGTVDEKVWIIWVNGKSGMDRRITRAWKRCHFGTRVWRWRITEARLFHLVHVFENWWDRQGGQNKSSHFFTPCNVFLSFHAAFARFYSMCFYFARDWTWHGRFGTVNTLRIHRCWRELLSLRKVDLIWSYSDNRVLRIQNLHQNFVELWPGFEHPSAQFSILVRDVNMLSSFQGRSTNCTESRSNDISFVHLSYIIIVEENGVSIFAGRLAFHCLNHAGIKESIFPRSTDTYAKKRIFRSSSGGKHTFCLDGCRTIRLFLVRN